MMPPISSSVAANSSKVESWRPLWPSPRLRSLKPQALPESVTAQPEVFLGNGCLTVLGDTTNTERVPQGKPRTDSEFPANCARNSCQSPVRGIFPAYLPQHGSAPLG